MLHVAGNIDTGDFVVVPLGNGQDILLRLMLGHWQGGVDMDLVDGGNLVQHHLEGFQVGEGFPPPVSTKSQLDMMVSIRRMLAQIFSVEKPSSPHTSLF